MYRGFESIDHGAYDVTISYCSLVISVVCCWTVICKSASHLKINSYELISLLEPCILIK